MGQAKLYGQKTSGGLFVNGSIKDYYSAEKILSGDLVEIVGETQVKPTTSPKFDGIAKTSGAEGTKVSVYTLN